MKKLAVVIVSVAVVAAIGALAYISWYTDGSPSATGPTATRPASHATAPATMGAAVGSHAASSQDGAVLSDVKVSSSSFDPTRGQVLQVQYRLSKRARVDADFYDPDFALVRRISTDGLLEPGYHTVTWDGKDADGTVVPDEAFFFTLVATGEVGQTHVYDPTTFSGGEGADITEAHVDPGTQTITYRLPVMARVLVRLGVQDGPLLKTLVDWKPRVAGEITEYWNGKDADGLIDLADHPRFKRAQFPNVVWTLKAIGSR